MAEGTDRKLSRLTLLRLQRLTIVTELNCEYVYRTTVDMTWPG